MTLTDKINFQKEIFQLRFNWGGILAFVVFWSYGFLAQSSSYKGRYQFWITLFLSVILLIFLILHFKSPLYKDGMTFTLRDLFVFLSYLAFPAILVYSALWNPFTSDPFYHSQLSVQHARIILERDPNLEIHFDRVPYSILIQSLNLILLALALGLLAGLRRLHYTIRIVIILILFLYFRASISTSDIFYNDPHPPFRLFPLWLSSTILSPSYFSFRLPQFLGLVAMMFFMHRITIKYWSFISSWLFGLAFGTIPLFLTTGLQVEQSIWTGIIWSLMLVYFLLKKDSEEFHWVRWFSLLSIGTLMRQTAFIGFVFLAFAYLYYSKDIRIIYSRILNFRRPNSGETILPALKNIILSCLPILSFITFTGIILLSGTPATAGGDSLVFAKLLDAFSKKVVIRSIMNSISPPWVILLALAFIPFRLKIKNIYFAVTSFIFFLATLYTFYSIHPSLWGATRYQTEYIMPFTAVGLVFILYRFHSSSRSRITTTVFLCLMLLLNVLTYKAIPHYNEGTDRIVERTDFNAKYIRSEKIYNYNTALREVKHAGLAGSSYTAGLTYGTMNEILNGYTLKETKATGNIQNELGTVWVAPYEKVVANKKIKIVLISDHRRAQEMLNHLLANGFAPWKSFHNKKYRSTIHGLIRHSSEP